MVIPSQGHALLIGVSRTEQHGDVREQTMAETEKPAFQIIVLVCLYLDSSFPSYITTTYNGHVLDLDVGDLRSGPPVPFRPISLEHVEPFLGSSFPKPYRLIDPAY